MCKEKSDICKNIKCKNNEKCVVNDKIASCICNDSSHLEDNQCFLNIKKVQCKEVSPENATSDIVDKDTTWNTQTNSWNEVTCNWRCDNGFIRVDDLCEVNNKACDDGKFCTINDTLYEQNICKGEENLCDDNDSETIDTCDEENDKCVNTNKSKACDDGKFCTINDTLDEQNICSGITNPCDDNNESTIDSCDINTDQCVNTIKTGPCDDGKFCTINDSYNINGICTGEVNPCNDNDESTVDSCNINTDQCVNTIKTGPCDDGKFCTINDHYNASGDCVGGGENYCNDNNGDTWDSCSNRNSTCYHELYSEIHEECGTCRPGLICIGYNPGTCGGDSCSIASDCDNNSNHACRDGICICYNQYCIIQPCIRNSDCRNGTCSDKGFCEL